MIAIVKSPDWRCILSAYRRGRDRRLSLHDDCPTDQRRSAGATTITRISLQIRCRSSDELISLQAWSATGRGPQSSTVFLGRQSERNLRQLGSRNPRLHGLRAASAARTSTGPARPTLGAAADHQPGTGNAGARDRPVVQRPQRRPAARLDGARSRRLLRRGAGGDHADRLLLPRSRLPGAAICRRAANARRFGTRDCGHCFPAIELTLLVGSYAIHYYLPRSRRRSMTAAVACWRDFLPEFFVLPHPSWRTIALAARQSLVRSPRSCRSCAPGSPTRSIGQALSRMPRSAPCPRR